MREALFEPSVEVALRDGTPLGLRPIRPDDAPLVEAGFDRLSDRSRYMRFFGAPPRLTSTLLRYMTDVDGVDHFAVIAFDRSRPSDVAGGTDGLGVGVARYIRRPEAPDSAEAAVTVIDEYQGRGVGTVLLQAIAVVAEHHDIDRFVSPVLAENRAMQDLFRTLGGQLERDPDDATVLRATVEVPHAESPFAGSRRHDILTELLGAAVG